jgi:hypothetical protein
MSHKWLILAYKLPSEPTRSRTYIWRQLKQLGALYVHQSFWVLPNLPEMTEAMEHLKEKIAEFEGECSLLSGTGPEDWDLRIKAQLNTARDDEYKEVAENIDRLNYEIDRESAAGKFNFAELEDVESDFEKIHRWLERVKVRDYFGAALAEPTAASLAAVKVRVDEFASQVLEVAGLLDQAKKDD